MQWYSMNKKQKKVFVILIIVLVIVFISAIPLLNGRGPISGKFVALILIVSIKGIVNLFENDYEENVSEGNCIKCNKSCQTIYYEKRNKIEYDCPTCGKYKK
jgi:hypothetical protein